MVTFFLGVDYTEILECIIVYRPNILQPFRNFGLATFHVDIHKCKGCVVKMEPNGSSTFVTSHSLKTRGYLIFLQTIYPLNVGLLGKHDDKLPHHHFLNDWDVFYAKLVAAKCILNNGLPQRSSLFVFANNDLGGVQLNHFL